MQFETRLFCYFRGKLLIKKHLSDVILRNIYNAFTIAHLNSRQNIGFKNDFFHTHTLQIHELYGAILHKGFCLVSVGNHFVVCHVNANLEHHNTVYVIHFKNAFVFK
jgi:hypothetical protein